MRIIETCPKCGHDLTDLVLTTYPPIPQKKCFNCGWEWTGKAEEVIRVSFDETDYSPCKYCSNNPRNGGSGVCHCINGTPKLTW